MEQAVADLVGPDLRVLFCGINPGTRSGELGLHFARPGNRFWKLLCAGGFTGVACSCPPSSTRCPGSGSASRTWWGGRRPPPANSVVAELREGATQLEAKVGMLRPRCVAVLGLQAYRTAFHRDRRPSSAASPNPSAVPCCGSCPTRAAFRPTTKLPEMTEMYKALRESAFGRL